MNEFEDLLLKPGERDERDNNDAMGNANGLG
jgi:hypothetical protein